MDMLGKKQDGVLVADYRVVFIPLNVAVVVFIVIQVFVKPLTRRKQKKWANYQLEVKVGPDSNTQGKVLDVYKLKRATRNRWKRAAIKTLLTNKLKLGFAAAAKGTGGAAKVVPGGAASGLLAAVKAKGAEPGGLS